MDHQLKKCMNRAETIALLDVCLKTSLVIDVLAIIADYFIVHLFTSVGNDELEVLDGGITCTIPPDLPAPAMSDYFPCGNLDWLFSTSCHPISASSYEFSVVINFSIHPTSHPASSWPVCIGITNRGMTDHSILLFADNEVGRKPSLSIFADYRPSRLLPIDKPWTTGTKVTVRLDSLAGTVRFMVNEDLSEEIPIPIPIPILIHSLATTDWFPIVGMRRGLITKTMLPDQSMLTTFIPYTNSVSFIS